MITQKDFDPQYFKDFLSEQYKGSNVVLRFEPDYVTLRGKIYIFYENNGEQCKDVVEFESNELAKETYYTLLKNGTPKGCEYCNLSILKNTKNPLIHLFSDDTIILKYGDYVKVVSDEQMCFYALGDGYTESYYPNFCPNCGRRINNALPWT